MVRHPQVLLSDKLTTLATGVSAIPVFVLGYILIYVPADARAELVDLPGVGAPEDLRPGAQHLGALLHPDGRAVAVYLVLPAVTLACVSTALCACMMGSMLDVLRADHANRSRQGSVRALDRRAPWHAQRFIPS